MTKLIVIGGPTASGKTDLAVKIAKEFNGELINADSRQVYRYLDIGTNKGNIERRRPSRLSPSESNVIGGIPIHLIDFLNPDQQFSVFEYKKLAEQKIEEITSRGKLPILVGGTGLYIDAVIKSYQLSVDSNQFNPDYRSYLNNLNANELQNILKAQSPGLLAQLNNSDKNNPRRLIRLIEKSKVKTRRDVSQRTENLYESLFLYPEYNWNELKIKIDNRVEAMFGQTSGVRHHLPASEKNIFSDNRQAGVSGKKFIVNNIIDEVRMVLEIGFSKDSIALQGIGYREVLDYIDGKIDLQKCIELVKIAHRQYAKRQRTWFESPGRNYKLTKVNEKINTKVKEFLNGTYTRREKNKVSRTIKHR